MELNNIYNMNCLEGMKELTSETIDLIITSPPYSDLKQYDTFAGIHPDEYVDWFLPIVSEMPRILKSTGSFILNINDKVDSDGFRHPYVFDLVSRICKETPFKLYERLFWNKGKYLPNRKRFGDKVEYLLWFVKSKDYKFNIDEMRVPYDPKSIKRMTYQIKKRHSRTKENQDADDYKDWKPNILGALPSTLVTIGSESRRISDNHVAVYPERLVDYFVKGSTNEGDIVLDPFMGSGTTAVVCEKLKRNWIGFDVSQLYIDDANKRISDIKSQNQSKVNT